MPYPYTEMDPATLSRWEEAEFRRIPDDEPAYATFARLYAAARTFVPGQPDQWNRRLYERGDRRWDAFHPVTGSMRLRSATIDGLRSLEAPVTSDRTRAEVFGTVLHESKHAAHLDDAPDEPNAVRGQASQGLEEGLVSYLSAIEFDEFAERAGAPGTPRPPWDYGAAAAVTQTLLTRAVGFSRVDETARAVLATPMRMHFDAIADAWVNARLADVVPADETHRRVARAALIGAMADERFGLLTSSEHAAAGLEEDLAIGLHRAEESIHGHYTSAAAGLPMDVPAPNPPAAGDLRPAGLGSIAFAGVAASRSGVRAGPNPLCSPSPRRNGFPVARNRGFSEQSGNRRGFIEQSG